MYFTNDLRGKKLKTPDNSKTNDTRSITVYSGNMVHTTSFARLSANELNQVIV